MLQKHQEVLMNKKIYTLFILFLTLISFSASGLMAADAAAVPNNGFEKIDARGFPVQWHLETGEKEQVKIDNRNAHAGENCLLIAHKEWGKSTLVSEVLDFNVGHLYRLSGWVKTELAVTRPTDRYPTSAAACLTMESFPFTNH
jgi:hypothetical protein